ncbi:BCCT family transporter [Rhizobium sp. TRM96647]|uniref:BCCT family transporter n=1 Tax=unclassified Rhizobium TaxID=2613769 RepID=UPI0021E750DD|nr:MULTISPECIES: BCCT family transporter [unclassified Rhizobium]MCV3738739.1 BCCT family transporter [Rhizobium sp. TRM96647]MCV3760426.1 BCCT family transporter [Rhizobium sp. TRM96650]
MFNLKLNPPVFLSSVAVISLFVGVGVVAPRRAEVLFGFMQSGILTQFGWLYLLAVAIFLIAIIILAFGRYGELKLGPDDSEPEFHYLSWLAMLFAAGMGIGLMYFAVGEPLTHFVSPPEAEPSSVAAMREAMSVTFFHWGIHAWAVYAVVGLSLAYFGYRYDLPLTVRSGLYPLLKNRIHGPIGHAVDIFAICGTLFGLATSLGFGVLQINSGLNFLIGVPVSIYVQIALVAVVTAIATISVVTGVAKGVRILSELNLAFAVLLMLFVLFVGPTNLLMRDFVQNIGLYLDSLLLRTFNIYAYEPRPWIDQWTLFYWAWWISWSPFVGMFIARISRGRTVREFVVAVLFVPAIFTFFWMTIFGNTAMYVDTTLAGGALSQDVKVDLSVALFQFFEYLPLSFVTSTLAVILVSVFFVTSCDSGSLVIDTIASGGNTDTPVLQRVFWCALSGLVAAVLLAAGGLSALQSATISTALPFAIVMLLLVLSLFIGMKADVEQQRARQLGTTNARPASEVPWQKWLGQMLSAPRKGEVEAFLQRTCLAALQQVARELETQERPALVTSDASDGLVSLTSSTEGLRDFVYGVRIAEYKLPAFTIFEADQKAVRFEARTFFGDGSSGYNIMGFSQDQIINDVVVQFERYLAQVRSLEASLLTAAPGTDKGITAP